MHSSIHQTQLAEGATPRDRAAPKAPPGPIWFTVPNLVFMGLFLLGAMLVLIDVSLRVYEAGGAGVTDQRTVQNYADFLLDPYFLQIVWRSVVMAMTVVLATLVLGLPLAIGLSRTTGIWRALLYFAVLAPLLTSVVVRTFGWMMLLSNNGFINSTLRELEIIRLPIRMMYQMTGVDIVMTHVHLPFMVLALDAALLNINPQVYEAARNLGAGATRIFFRITLPLCMPGIVAGSILVFALAISSFVTPALIGGPRNPVIAMVIYQQGVSLLNWPFGAAMSIGLMVLLVAIMMLFLKLTSRAAQRAS